MLPNRCPKCPIGIRKEIRGETWKTYVYPCCGFSGTPQEIISSLSTVSAIQRRYRVEGGCKPVDDAFFCQSIRKDILDDYKSINVPTNVWYYTRQYIVSKVPECPERHEIEKEIKGVAFVHEDRVYGWDFGQGVQRE